MPNLATQKRELESYIAARSLMSSDVMRGNLECLIQHAEHEIARKETQQACLVARARAIRNTQQGVHMHTLTPEQG